MKKNGLNVLRYGYYKGGLASIPNNIKQFFKNIKYAYQRITKGYCDFDVWELSDYYLKLFYYTLNSLADNTHGYPANGIFIDEKAQELGYNNGYEYWLFYLRETAELFKRGIEEENPCYAQAQEQYHELLRAMDIPFNADVVTTIRKRWVNMEAECSKQRIQDVEQAFKNLNEYFFDLWD